MMNLKYFAFLMIGIFLALGLGMMIGITLENQNIIENQQVLLARQIEERFIALREDNLKLKENFKQASNENQRLNDLSGVLLEEAVRGRLAGLNIAIISFAEENQPNDLLDFLHRTGAAVQSDISLHVSSIPEIFGKDIEASSIQYQKELISAVIEDIIYSITYGGATPLIEEMQGLKLLNNTGGYETPIHAFVLIGRGYSTRDYDALLIQHAIEAGISVIAVEMGDVSESCVPFYKSYGISTVEHVDSMYGKLALTSVLSGSHGSYGFSSDSEAPLPDPLFKEVDRSNLATVNGEETP